MSLAGPIMLASFGEAPGLSGSLKGSEDRFNEESKEGIQLLDSIRVAVENVLSDADLSDFELVYPDEGPVPGPELEISALSDNSTEVLQLELEELELVYPSSPTPSEAPLSRPPVLVPSQDASMTISPLSISLQPSPAKTLDRQAFLVPANPDTCFTHWLPQGLYSSAPLTALQSPGFSTSDSTPLPQVPYPAAVPLLNPYPTPPPTDRNKPPVRLRLCSNSGCNGVVNAARKRSRCMGCVTKGWRSSDGSDPHSSADATRSKSKRKRVSWFDGYEKDQWDAKNASAPEEKQIQVCESRQMEDVMDVDEPEHLIRGWDSDLTDSELEEVTSASSLAVGAGPSANPSSETSSSRCTIKYCNNFLPLHYKWKCCPPCRKHHREYQRKRLGCDNKYDGTEGRRAPNQDVSQMVKPNNLSVTPVFSKNQLGSYTLQDPAGLVTNGARICTIRGCKHIVPNVFEYKYKICFPCRVRTTRNARKRQAKMGGQAILPPKVDEMPIEEAIPSAEPLSPQNPIRALTGRCASLDCGLRLDPDRWKRLQSIVKHGSDILQSGISTEEADVNCEQCAWRKLPPDTRKNCAIDVHRRVRVVRAEPLASADTNVIPKSCIRPNALTIKIPRRPVPPPKPRLPAPYPEYQSLPRLITDLQELFSKFRQGQSYYVAYNQLQNNPVNPTNPAPLFKFAFDGEFSVVSSDFEVLKRKDKVEAAVTTLMQEVERVALVKFRSDSRSCGAAYGGLVTRFYCKHMMADFPLVLNGMSFPPPMREVQGELEVVVLPVDSHRCFFGQRTVVRFRLVG